MDSNRTLMIRLIDVALIILLGFIGISRLKTEYVDLPVAGDPQPLTRTFHEAAVHIYKDSFEIRANGKRSRFTSVTDLEQGMLAANTRLTAEGGKVVFSIESHEQSLMQSLIDVLDICQRHNFEKSFNYERIR